MISDLKHPDTFMTRHAVQALLHHAIHLQGEFCAGILIGRQGEIESHQSCQGEDGAVADLSKQTNIMGLYRSYADFSVEACMQDVRDTAKRVGLQQVPDIFMAIMLSTKGRVENVAFQVKDKQLLPLKLIMQEDGQLKMKVLG